MSEGCGEQRIINDSKHDCIGHRKRTYHTRFPCCELFSLEVLQLICTNLLYNNSE